MPLNLEADLLEAMKFGIAEGITPILELIEELREKCNAPEKRMGDLALPSDEVMEVVKGAIYDELVEARKLKGKQIRNDKVAELREKVLHEHFSPSPETT